MERNGGGDLGAKQRFPSRWKNKSFPELEIPIRKTPNFPLFKKKIPTAEKKNPPYGKCGEGRSEGEKTHTHKSLSAFAPPALPLFPTPLFPSPPPPPFV